MEDKALKGIKVLEYCNMISGPFCTKLMADLGAEVIKVEPPDVGDEARMRGPFPGDVPHREKSGLFLYLNTNKFGITLDPGSPRGSKIFKALVREADVLIENRPLGDMEQMGLGYEDLEKINPGLIMTSIKPFGRSGPYKDYKAYSLNISHVSGQGYLLPLLSPNSDRPPVKAGGNSSDYDPGLVTVVAVMAALFWKGVTGKGQFIELSKQEALMSMQRVESVTFANGGPSMSRLGARQGRQPGGILPCKDGYIVLVTPQDRQWEAFVKLMGDPEWSKGELNRDADARSKHALEINEEIIKWTMKHTKKEIFTKGQALSCPIAPVNSPKDVVESEQMEARKFFDEMVHPEVGRLKKFPSAPFKMSKTPWRLDRPAPLLGQHNEEIYSERLGYTADELAQLKKANVI
jgi:CoA:oxalate CoA-transferase